MLCGAKVDEAQIPAMEDLLALGRGGGAGGARPPKVHKVGEGSFGEAFKVDRCAPTTRAAEPWVVAAAMCTPMAAVTCLPVPTHAAAGRWSR